MIENLTVWNNSGAISQFGPQFYGFMTSIYVFGFQLFSKLLPIIIFLFFFYFVFRLIFKSKIKSIWVPKISWNYPGWFISKNPSVINTINNYDKSGGVNHDFATAGRSKKDNFQRFPASVQTYTVSNPYDIKKHGPNAQLRRSVSRKFRRQYSVDERIRNLSNAEIQKKGYSSISM